MFSVGSSKRRTLNNTIESFLKPKGKKILKESPLLKMNFISKR